MGTSDEEIASTAEDTIKNIVAQDCDVLRRPLLELSDCDMCPTLGKTETINDAALAVLHTMSSREEKELSSHPTSNSNLASRCKNVLRFIDALPEKDT
jgi:hypothetical protein